MTPSLFFWTLAEVLLLTTCFVALLGWLAVRQGELARHRRLMHTAGGLIATFLVAYVLKVVYLGREDLSLWSPAAVAVLRLHETVVALMLLSALAARLLAKSAFHAYGTTGSQALEPLSASLGAHRWHRLLGRVALVCALCAVLTAGAILAGMHARKGGARAPSPSAAPSPGR